MSRRENNHPQADTHTGSNAMSRSAKVVQICSKRTALIALGGVLLAAAPAAAVVQPWNPATSRPGIDPPVSVDQTSVPAQATAFLAVLRRPQTTEDRAAAAPLLTTVGMGSQIAGVRTDGIRALGGGWVLVPAATMKTSGSTSTSDPLCITNGELIGCGGSGNVASIGVSTVEADPASHITTYAGIVPDSVARVRFLPGDGGAPSEVAVASNFYALDLPGLAQSSRVKPPAGYSGPLTSFDAPPMPIDGKVVWLNADGAVVGPGQ